MMSIKRLLLLLLVPCLVEAQQTPTKTSTCPAPPPLPELGNTWDLSQPRHQLEYARWHIFVLCKDHPTAKYWYEKAALAGITDAQAELGIVELKDRNYETALSWLAIAAHTGNPDAEYAIATVYLDGLGVTPSETAARYFLSRAASRGHKFATQLLAKMPQR